MSYGGDVGPFPGASGGGIRGDDVTLVSSFAFGNTTLGYTSQGGGIAGGRVTLVDSSVGANHAGADGGGIAGGEVTLIGSHVDGNTDSG